MLDLVCLFKWLKQSRMQEIWTQFKHHFYWLELILNLFFKNVFSPPLIDAYIVKKRCLREWTLFSAFLNPLKSLSIWFRILLVCETLLRCKYHFSSYHIQSLPVVVIRCEENEIYQLDFRIETDNIRYFILLSGLRNLRSKHLMIFRNLL